MDDGAVRHCRADRRRMLWCWCFRPGGSVFLKGWFDRLVLRHPARRILNAERWPTVPVKIT